MLLNINFIIKGKLTTLDLVEVNPLLKTCESDIEKTLFSASRAILSFFGYKTLGTSNAGNFRSFIKLKKVRLLISR